MLDTRPDKLFEEIRQAERFMKLHEAGPRRLMRRYAGRFYRGKSGLDIAISENHGYQVLSRMIGRISFDNPKALVNAVDPDQSGQIEGGIGSTMGDTALGLSAYVNRWSKDNDFGDPLEDIAYDYFFYMGVCLTVVGDRPGEQVYENVVPQQPYALRLDPFLYGVDPQSKSMNVFSLDGPRFKYHMWKADKEDLLKDPKYNHDAVEAIADDTDIERYTENDRGHNGSHDMHKVPRKEILAWDIWVPEDQRSNDSDLNGSWHTIATSTTGNGMGKRARSIREPRPAYCPPWGPYVEFGAYKVPNSPIPLSPLVATAEAAEEVNSHAVQAARDARSFKRFATGNANNKQDAQTAKAVKHGQMALFEDPDSVQEKTIGGVDPNIYQYLAVARERLSRESGLGEASQSNPQPGVTATAESISDASSNAIVRNLQKRFIRGVDRVFRSALFYAFYGDDVSARVRLEDGRSGIFIGGISPGQEGFNFFDLEISTQPYSLDGNGKDTLRNTFLQLFQTMAQAAPAMAEAPYVDWPKIIDPMMQINGLGTSAELIDAQVLEQVSGIRLQQNAERGSTPSPPGSFPNRTSSDRSNETPAELAGSALA